MENVNDQAPPTAAADDSQAATGRKAFMANLLSALWPVVLVGAATLYLQAKLDAAAAEVAERPRVIVVDEGHQSYGITGEIASRINEKAFYHLDAPVLRMGAMDVPVPFSPVLEDLTVPTPEAVVEKARKLVSGEMIHAA